MGSVLVIVQRGRVMTEGLWMRFVTMSYEMLPAPRAAWNRMFGLFQPGFLERVR